MSKEIISRTAPEGAIPTQTPIFHHPMSRRKMLGVLAATSSVVVGGSVLAACGGPSTPQAAAPVTLTIGDWPFNVLPSTVKKGDTDPANNALVASLKDWSKLNPNVTLKHTAIDISTPQKLEAAIAAHTSPDYYGGLGSLSLDRASAALGLAADTTDVIKQYKVDSLLADYALPIWKQRGSVDGKYYGLPGDTVSVGAGLYYRRDILQKKGIAEPKAGWTWEDFRTLAKSVTEPGKAAMGAPSYMIGWFINANGLDAQPDGGILGSNPAPGQSWHWRVNATAWIDEWKSITGLYRKLVNDDKLIQQNATTFPWEGPAVSQFASGQFPLSPGFAFLYAIAGYGPVVIGDMEKKFGKPLDELVGFTPYPDGTNNAKNAAINANFGTVLLSPHLKTDALDKAANLWLYMFYGDGYINKRAAIYNATKDPKSAYDYIAPGNRYQKNPKVPADVTVEKAYGARFVADYMGYINLPQVPDAGLFFPADTQTGPTKDAHNSLLQALSGTNQDVTAAVTKFQDTYNQQASTLKSDLTADQFKAGAKKYYAALDAFWQQKAPDFHSGDWTKFYTTQVLPALG